MLISRKALQEVLGNVIGVANSRSTMPILSNVLIDVDNDVFSMTATNLDISVKTGIKLENIESKDGYCIAVKELHDLLRECNAKYVELIHNDHQLVIKFNNGEYKLLVIDACEFPSLPEVGKDRQINIDMDVLNSIFNRVAFCASNNDTRRELNGMSVIVKNNVLSVAATDGHKLSKINRKVECQNIDVIIPKMAVDYLGKINDTCRRIFINDNFLMIEYDNTVFYSRLVEGPYPNYEQVIPYNNSKQLKYNRDSMVSALKRVKIFSNPVVGLVKFDVQGKQVDLYGSDVGMRVDGHEALVAEFSNDKFVFGVNANYLLEILGKISSEEVIVRLSDPLVAQLLYPGVQKEGEEWMCLLMPLKLE